MFVSEFDLPFFFFNVFILVTRCLISYGDPPRLNLFFAVAKFIILQIVCVKIDIKSKINIWRKMGSFLSPFHKLFLNLEWFDFSCLLCFNLHEWINLNEHKNFTVYKNTLLIQWDMVPLILSEIWNPILIIEIILAQYETNFALILYSSKRLLNKNEIVILVKYCLFVENICK